MISYPNQTLEVKAWISAQLGECEIESVRIIQQCVDTHCIDGKLLSLLKKFPQELKNVIPNLRARLLFLEAVDNLFSKKHEHSIPMSTSEISIIPIPTSSAPCERQCTRRNDVVISEVWSDGRESRSNLQQMGSTCTFLTSQSNDHFGNTVHQLNVAGDANSTTFATSCVPLPSWEPNLQQAINEGKLGDRVVKLRFIRACAKFYMGLKFYPTQTDYHHICSRLIEEFPILRDPAETPGYPPYLKLKRMLSMTMRNLRRNQKPHSGNSLRLVLNSIHKRYRNRRLMNRQIMVSADGVNRFDGKPSSSSSSSPSSPSNLIENSEGGRGSPGPPTLVPVEQESAPSRSTVKIEDNADEVENICIEVGDGDGAHLFLATELGDDWDDSNQSSDQEGAQLKANGEGSKVEHLSMEQNPQEWLEAQFPVESKHPNPLINAHARGFGHIPHPVPLPPLSGLLHEASQTGQLGVGHIRSRFLHKAAEFYLNMKYYPSKEDYYNICLQLVTAFPELADPDSSMEQPKFRMLKKDLASSARHIRHRGKVVMERMQTSVTPTTDLSTPDETVENCSLETTSVHDANLSLLDQPSPVMDDGSVKEWRFIPFPAPVPPLPDSVRWALQEDKPLDSKTRRQLLCACATFYTNIIYYPSRSDYNNICFTLVDKYPQLLEQHKGSKVTQVKKLKKDLSNAIRCLRHKEKREKNMFSIIKQDVSETQQLQTFLAEQNVCVDHFQ